MWIDYTEKISESADELRALEKRRSSDRSVADRLKMLRLLKAGQCQSQQEAADVLGYSRRQVGRWLSTYREDGLVALCHTQKPGGKDERVTEEAWKALCKKMKAGEVARLKDAQTFLREEFGIEYESESGISRLFKRRGAKLKTGRPRHRDADPERQATFKK
jgi:transposase